ncbi:hypothetical protein MTR_1g093160 [Medicago truncatula]|uniref:Transcription factor C2H2 family n=1 Tax=Medicago truncatula TaxID=3880 RepID=G7I473_MEDTR|nr:hypothetical protein MTR_1g093160 [Medicago truncatula]
MVGGLVNKAKLTAPLTCPLCSNIFREPTTIPECLHTCKSFLFSSSFSPLFNYAMMNIMPCFHLCLLCDEYMPKSLSLVTVCRECIERKFIDERLNHCPVCKVDLGYYPLDKLKYSP